MIELLGDDWKGNYKVEGVEFRNLWAVQFVVQGILEDGVSSSSILDGLAKSFGEFLRAHHVAIPTELLAVESQRRRKASVSSTLKIK